MSVGAIRAGSAYVELFVRDRLGGGLRAASARLRAFGASIAAVGRGFLTAGLALGAPLAASAKLFADMGSDMLDMSQRTGVAVEALSELRYAAEQSGSSAEDLENALKFMQRGGFGQGADDLERIADQLAEMESPAQRTALAIQVFGRAGTRMLPMLINGAAGVRQLREEARRLGITMSTEDAQAAEQFGDTLSTLWTVTKRAAFTIGASLAPTLQIVAQWITRAAVSVREFIDRNRGLVQIIAMGVAAFTSLGIALLILGPAFSAIGAALGLIVTLLGAVASSVAFMLTPLGLFLKLIDTAVTSWFLFTDAGQSALSELGKALSDIGETFGITWRGIVAAMRQGNLALAARIAALGIRLAFEQALNAIVGLLRTIWTNITNFFNRIFGTVRERAIRLLALQREAGLITQEQFAQQVQTINQIEQEQTALEAANQAANTQATAQELQRAQEELARLLFEAQKEGAASRNKNKEALRAAIGGRPPTGEMLKAPSAGTFSATAAAALGGGQMDRLIRLNEEGNRHLAAIRRAAEEGGLVFA